jgi:hypothetical protein
MIISIHNLSKINKDPYPPDVRARLETCFLMFFGPPRSHEHLGSWKVAQIEGIIMLNNSKKKKKKKVVFQVRNIF